MVSYLWFSWFSLIKQQGFCNMLKISAMIFCFVAMALVSSVDSVAESSNDLKKKIDQYIQENAIYSDARPDEFPDYKFSTVPESNIVIVYLIGREFCGSGGCSLLFLDASGEEFTEIGSTALVNFPVTYKGKSKNGFPKFGVTVRGGGIMEPLESILSFNGKEYPGSAYSKSAQKVTSIDKNSILIDENTPTYSSLE